MTVRERTEGIERELLAPYACLAAQSAGRASPLEPCPLRTDFQRDRDRILHCKSFRRLKHKTQCFLAPEGDHFRTRLTHTLEVSQIARTISRALRLNEDLTEAIALGHDLGHTPFGHMGERILNELNPGGFAHERQSLRVVEVLENEGDGLNLTWEVRDGILNHTKRGQPATLEGEVVSLADRIAYINHDIDDALRAGVLAYRELPQDLLAVLGDTHGKRIDTMIQDVVTASFGQRKIAMSPAVGQATERLRTFMFERVYTRQSIQMEQEKAEMLLRSLFSYYLDHAQLIPEEFNPGRDGVLRHTAVCDYIACMTDQYAVRCFMELFIPKSESIARRIPPQ